MPPPDTKSSALFVRKMAASSLGVNVTDKATGKDVGLVAEDGLFISAVFRKTVFCI
ncbi:MAG: hypothetical protein ACLRXB_02190 [Escherichia coli]